MPCRPDSQMIMCRPTACQMDSRMMAGMAVPGLLSQATAVQAPPVMVLSAELNRPSSS